MAKKTKSTANNTIKPIEVIDVSKGARLRRAKTNTQQTIKTYLRRRPHRSFRMTRRRDYVRSLQLPGYWAFTGFVVSTISTHRRLFAGVVLTYAVLGALFVGLASQDAYSQLSQLLDDTGEDIFSGGWGSIGQAALLLYSGLTGSLNPSLTDAQQVYAALIFLLTWLTTVWLLRASLAGKRPRLRDGLYNGAAPLVATAVVLVILLVQLLPAALAIIVMNSAIASSLFDYGFIAMIVSLAVVMLVLLSIYWATSTFIALVIVTLPGMYPWQAVRTAGDIVIGRRIRLLLRILWLMVINAVIWLIVMLPIVLISRWLSGMIQFLESLPVVPMAMTFAGSIIIVWSATYIYLLYRKVVEDDAQPA